MSVHLRRPAQSALRELVVCHRRPPRQRPLRLQNRLRRQLLRPNLLRLQSLRPNLLRRQLRPHNQETRLDQCHLLCRSPRLVAAEAPRSQSRRLLLLRADVAVYLRLFLPQWVVRTQRGRCGCHKPSRPHCMSEINQLHSLFQISSCLPVEHLSVFDHDNLRSHEVTTTALAGGLSRRSQSTRTTWWY